MAKPMTMLELTELENFRRMCVHDLRIESLDDGSLEASEPLQRQVLSLFYAFHHYFHADPDEVEALCEGDLQGSPEFPAISGIFRSVQDEDEPTSFAEAPIDVLVAFQRKNNLTPGAIKKDILKLHANLLAYLEGLQGVTKNLKPVEQRLRALGFTQFGGDHCPVTLRVLLHVIPNKTGKKTILNAIDEVEEHFPHGPALRILFGDDIDYEVRNTEARFQFVPKGSLTLDSANNHCDYQEGDHRAMFVNVRAASLRRLWQTCASKGLLAQNLRYFVSLPRVDSAMLNTMRNVPQDFWYLNNGLTIVCKNFTLSGEKLVLRDFSIVNGGQTTHNIGTIEELPNDFALPCKVIALERRDRRPLSDDDQTDFIAEVCTATNSQKPIKAVDAVTNLREIRELRRALKASASPIYLISKRGEKIDATLYPKPWDRIKVQTLGQLFLSFLYQYPCTARNKTKELFENEALFALLFNYNDGKGFKYLPPIEFVRDLLLLSHAIKAFQKRWASTTVRQGDTTNQQYRSLTSNGAFLLIACVGALCKLHTHALAAAIHTPGSVEDRKLLSRYDVAFPFLNERDIAMIEDPDGDLQRLLTFCLERFITPGYRTYCEKEGKSSDYSNFAKSDDRYLGYVQKCLLTEAQKGFTPTEQELIDRVFRTPTDAERASLAEMIVGHPVKWGAEHDEYIKDLLDRITQACKLLDCRPRGKYPIPKKAYLRAIVNRNPSSLADLNCADLTPTQTQAYGETILRVLNEAKAELGASIGKVAEASQEEDDDA